VEICNVDFHYLWAALPLGVPIEMPEGVRWGRSAEMGAVGGIYLLTSGMACKPQINWLG